MPLIFLIGKTFLIKSFSKEKGFHVRLGSECCSVGQKDRSVPKEKRCGRDEREYKIGNKLVS